MQHNDDSRNIFHLPLALPNAEADKNDDGVLVEATEEENKELLIKINKNMIH